MAAAEVWSTDSTFFGVANSMAWEANRVPWGAGRLAEFVSLSSLVKDHHVYSLGTSSPHSPLTVVFILVACVRVEQQ